MKVKKANKIDNSSERSLAKIKFNNFFKNNKTLISVILILLLITVAIMFNNYMTNSAKEKEVLIYGNDVIEMHYFYLITCPHCIEQKKFHKILLEKYPNLKIIEYDMADKESREKYLELAKAQNFKDIEKNIATPTTFIANKSNVGFASDEVTGKLLIEMIEEENTRILNNWNNETMKTTLQLRSNAQVVK